MTYLQMPSVDKIKENRIYKNSCLKFWRSKKMDAIVVEVCGKCGFFEVSEQGVKAMEKWVNDVRKDIAKNLSFK